MANKNNKKDIILLEMENGCRLCTSHCRDKCGYTRIHINGKQDRMHRYLYEIRYGKIDKGLVLRHKCDNAWCCNPNHLELGTQKDNRYDMKERGHPFGGNSYIFKKGIAPATAKLNSSQVVEIYNSDEPTLKLAKKFGVSRGTIFNIKKGITRRNITQSALVQIR